MGFKVQTSIKKENISTIAFFQAGTKSSGKKNWRQNGIQYYEIHK